LQQILIYISYRIEIIHQRKTTLEKLWKGLKFFYITQLWNCIFKATKVSNIERYILYCALNSIH